MKKILVFGAHPDDVEFGTGGLLIKEIEKGAKVKIVVCSFGEAGTNGTPSSRKAEAQASAKFIGAEIEFTELGGDSHMENSPKNALKLANIIRKYKPNIVLTTSVFENQHPDHLALSQMTRSACRLARYGGLKELKKLPVHTIDSLYFYPSSAGFEKKPDIIVDISPQYEKWVKAMSLHKSQMKTKNYINLISSRSRAYGASVGVEHASILWVNDIILVDSLTELSSSRNY
jgi:N-acetylglucosamine malate deacetylase 1